MSSYCVTPIGSTGETRQELDPDGVPFTASVQAQELTPACPFCAHHYGSMQDNGHGGGYRWMCTLCFALGPPADSMAAAAYRWCTRAAMRPATENEVAGWSRPGIAWLDEER